jgi:hypothetical protein
MPIKPEELAEIQRKAGMISDFRNEYQAATLWGSVPDGDVRWDVLIAWLNEHRDLVQDALKIGGNT